MSLHPLAELGDALDGVKGSPSELLNGIEQFVRRYVVLNEAQAAAIALWIVHSHALQAAETTPYIALTSGMKRSGKTRTLEVVELLVHEPLPTANISDAALFRAVGEKGPTLLMDEVDAVFGPKARDREDLRALLNAGYRRGAVVYRMGGAKMTTLESFPVFCAKAFAGIGTLPDTIADRAIPIRLERRTREEPVERFRRRDALEAAEPLNEWARSWADQCGPQLAEARPDLPDLLDDRAQDIWEPLLAIADLAGDGWPARARAAALELCGPEARQDEDDSLTALLINDVHGIFAASTEQRFRTSDLITELAKIEESPWGDWDGKVITAQALSRLMRPFKIKTMPVWVDGEKARGYKVEQFADAFHRVLGGRSGRSGRSVFPSDEAPTMPTGPTALGTGESTNGRAPAPVSPGFPEFPDYADQCFQDGIITEAEWLSRRKVHAAIEQGAKLWRAAQA